ncbi:MAG: TrkH family potassium uptake protein [Acidobacteriota bacterium]|nr:TrkH family potassium uptake protein [Acidobacteriota bacterium]
MNLRSAAHFLGRLVLLVAAAELVPMACSAFYQEWLAVRAFLVSALIAALVGVVLMRFGRQRGEAYRREGILVVAGGWILASILGAIPYILTGALLNPMDALFESASGFTTTGASVMTVIEVHGRGILFWRSFSQWLGGMGIVVLFVALLPELGPGARFLYKLEVPGPSAEALQPRIRDTALVLWKIYLALTALETLFLMLAGLDLYDALTHTFSTLSTGGFSPRNASVAAFGSPVVEIIIIVFMFLAGANFSLYFRVWQLKGWNLLRDTEFRLYTSIFAGATAFVTWNLLRSDTYEHVGRAILDSLFQVISILTTTGFATADFDAWPAFSRMLLIALFFVGGCAGSTAGSMKVMRMVIGLKSALREVRLIFSPNSVLRIFVSGNRVPDSVVRSVAGFFILYLSTWALGALFLSLGGPDIITAATASAATIGNIGPGLGAVGPTQNFAFFGAADKALMVLLMWLGRLEIYAMAALFLRSYWKP